MILESIYAHFMQKRRRENLAKRENFTPPCPILSVGNITTGGTGKTPAVQWLTRVLQGEGYIVGIAGRGYKGSLSQKGALVSDGKKTCASVHEVGDEAILHARNLPNAIVAIGTDRQYAVKRCNWYGANIVILDDGFQFWSLPRTFDLVLLDAKKPFGPNGKLLPIGRLREEPEALSRADAILFTRSEDVEREPIINLVRKYSNAPIFFSVHAPIDLKDEKTNEIIPLEWLFKKRVNTMSAIADNQQFIELLLSLRADVHNRIEHADHAGFDNETCTSACAIARNLQVEAIITTEKDAVKLNMDWFDVPVYSLRIGLQIENEAELEGLILGKLSTSP